VTTRREIWPGVFQTERPHLRPNFFPEPETELLGPPARVMVSVAHPDDADFGCAGTMAKWASEGSEILLVVATSGDKGTSDPDISPEMLVATREEEQRSAATVLGVNQVVYFRYGDGALEDTQDYRGCVVREIRRWKPDVVVTLEPYPGRHFSHRDHRISGLVTSDACFPYCRDRLHYPEHLSEGLEPHKVKTVLFMGPGEADVFVDVTDWMHKKVEALAQHASQISDISHIEERIRRWGSGTGELLGMQYAESFRKIEFRS
jgi:LmbE family N-acetylglucosaminyl deacetylase